MWVHFHDAYVAELRNMRKSKVKPNDCLLKEQQVVLFRPVSTGFAKKTFNSPGKWRLARIAKLHPSPYDGHTRSVDLQFFDPKNKVWSILESQSIQNIAPFELDLTAAIELSEQDLKKKKRETHTKPKKVSFQTMKTQWLFFAQGG